MLNLINYLRILSLLGSRVSAVLVLHSLRNLGQFELLFIVIRTYSILINVFRVTLLHDLLARSGIVLSFIDVCIKVWYLSSIVLLRTSFQIFHCLVLSVSVFSDLFFDILLVFLSSFDLIIYLKHKIMNSFLQLVFAFWISLHSSFHLILLWTWFIFISNPFIIWLLLNDGHVLAWSWFILLVVNFDWNSISTVIWRNSFLLFLMNSVDSSRRDRWSLGNVRF